MKAKANSPEETGNSGAKGISRRAFLQTSAVGTATAAAVGGMSKVGNARDEGPKPARLDEMKSDIRPALRRALASRKPACVNIICRTVPR